LKPSTSTLGRLRRALFAGSLLLLPTLQAQAAVHALLIGVGDYSKSQGMQSLQGPVNDVRLMKEVLSQRFKVPDSQIQVLTNEQATHSQIERAFEQLIGRVQKGDQVYIHYSGHGSWAEAPRTGPNAEPTGQDQTWVSYGARARPGIDANDKDNLEILDKEISHWLHRLHERTDDVVLVADSCHSATSTRDDQRGKRSAPKAIAQHPLRAKYPKREPLKTGVRIGAARDSESAVEVDPVGRGPCLSPEGCYGVFTWHWVQALRKSKPTDSWGSVFARAKAGMLSVPQVSQEPQIEGDHSRRAVFGGQFVEGPALVPVRTVIGSRLELGGGQLLGLTAGSILRGSGDARVEVTRVSAAGAEGKLLQGSAAKGDVLEVVEIKASDDKIRLFIGGAQVAGSDAALAARVRDSIEKALPFALKNFTLTTNRAEADWRLDLGRGRDGGPELTVLSPQNELMHALMRFPLAQADTELPRLINNLASLELTRKLRGIAATGNATPLSPEVVVLRPAPGNVDSCIDGLEGGKGWQRSAPRPLQELTSRDVQVRDCLAFRMANSADKPWYGYVLAADPRLKLDSVWPVAGLQDDDARMKPKAVTEIDGSALRIGEAGMYSLVFIASERPTPTTGLQQAGLRGDGGGGSPLLNLLRGGVATRNVESRIDIGRWGALTLDLNVAASQP
jgi:hypothetical protein